MEGPGARLAKKFEAEVLPGAGGPSDRGLDVDSPAEEEEPEYLTPDEGDEPRPASQIRAETPL